MANRTNVFQALLAGLRNTDNSILAGGTVEFYEPGTTTPKDVYTDPLKANPVSEVELDANGQAEIWGNGLFDVVIKNAAGVTKYTWESVYLGKDVFVPVAVIADYQANIEDSIIVVDTSAGNVTVTPPDPGEMQQAPFIVKSTDDAHTVTIARTGTTINGDANYVLSEQWEGVQLGFDGINFYTLGNFASIATTITTESSTSTAGKVELATDAEAIEGTDSARAVTPAALAAALALLTPVLSPAITGMGISNAADAEHDITISTGSARDSGNTTVITLGSAITKQIDANWTAGNNAGGFPSGLTLANSTWYRVFIIRNPSTGVVDAGFDTSATAANLLADAAGFTQYRRVGWVLTNGSANIYPFLFRNARVRWLPPIESRGVNQLGATTAIAVTVQAPPSLSAELYLRSYHATGSSATHYVLVTNPDETDVAAGSSAATFEQIQSSQYTVNHAHLVLVVACNATSKVRLRGSSANTYVGVKSLGFLDDRSTP